MARVFPLDGGALENWAFLGLVPALFHGCTHHCTVGWHDGMGCGGVMASRWHPGLDPWPHSSMCCKPMIGSETNNHSQPMRNRYLLLERDET